MPGLFVLNGVDMGSAISPLLFCLAIDPLLVMINRIPHMPIFCRAWMITRYVGQGLRV